MAAKKRKGQPSARSGTKSGALLVMRPVLPAVRPFRSGGVCLLLSLSLALAGGTLGLGPGSTAPSDERGGRLGQALLDGAQSLVGGFGAHIVAIFLFLAGVL